MTNAKPLDPRHAPRIFNSDPRLDPSGPYDRNYQEHLNARRHAEILAYKYGTERALFIARSYRSHAPPFNTRASAMIALLESPPDTARYGAPYRTADDDPVPVRPKALAAFVWTGHGIQALGEEISLRSISIDKAAAVAYLRAKGTGAIRGTSGIILLTDNQQRFWNTQNPPYAWYLYRCKTIIEGVEVSVVDDGETKLDIGTLARNLFTQHGRVGGRMRTRNRR